MYFGMKKAAAAIAAATIIMLANSAHAVTVWTDWTAVQIGNNGSATGSLNGVGVSYSGQVNPNTNINGSSGRWNPATSYVGGSVENSPASVNDIITLTGGQGTGTNTITFSSPITNPIIAIWSLGQPGLSAAFNFISATPIFQQGGPNSQFGGSAITVNGNTVSGVEGNGTIIFLGVFTSISWTNPIFENFYGFTVGAADASAVPVPGALILLVTGIAGLGFAARRKTA
jgi:hypothetical protein